MQVVEEALNIEQDQGCDIARFDTGLGGVDKRQTCVHGTVIVPGSELGGWEQVIAAGIR